MTFSNPAATQVVKHLADSELVFGLRARMILAEERPALQGYDQDKWANLAVLRRLGPAELERVGMHSERGPESLGHLMKLMAAHDLVHRRQIERVLSQPPVSS
jgi:hypothetical protein